MRVFPITASPSSFLFAYIAHDYHMLIYGAILGAMEMKAMECAMKLNLYLTENLFLDNPQLGFYIEAYSAMDIHVLVRFGRWHKILALDLPLNPDVMIYRASTLRYARAVAYANSGNDNSAKEEAKIFEEIRDQTDNTSNRYLHNNTVMDILNIKSLMIKGKSNILEEAMIQHSKYSVKLSPCRIIFALMSHGGSCSLYGMLLVDFF